MKQPQNIKLCLTGGHLSPALAVAQVCQQHYSHIQVIFIGRKTAFEHSSKKAVETEAMIPYTTQVYALPTGRVNVLGIVRFVLSFLRSFQILQAERPECILSFGGYVAVPVVLAGFCLRIPIVTHEQTQRLGKANKFISFFSKKVCVSFPELVAAIPHRKGKYTGFPLRPTLFSPPQRQVFAIEKGLRCIYITGGTTGAKSVNDIAFQALPELLSQFVIIHQTGEISLSKAKEIYDSLPKNIVSRYFYGAYFSSDDTSWILAHADLAISRSGANTVWELAVLGIPAVLVPLPWSANHEQQDNAAWLSTHGGAVIQNQNDLNASSLIKTIQSITTNYEQYKEHAQKFSTQLPRDGAQQLVEEVIHLIS